MSSQILLEQILSFVLEETVDKTEETLSHLLSNKSPESNLKPSVPLDSHSARMLVHASEMLKRKFSVFHQLSTILSQELVALIQTCKIRSTTTDQEKTAEPNQNSQNLKNLSPSREFQARISVKLEHFLTKTLVHAFQKFCALCSVHYQNTTIHSAVAVSVSSNTIRSMIMTSEILVVLN